MIALLPGKSEKNSGFQKRRTLRSALGDKSFTGTLISFDEKSGLVKVRLSNGRFSSFKINLLSDEDQEYIKRSQ